ncbi:FAD-dependent oxidoreductase [Clostridium sediminicola]|uniref:FAD-dependent oxidoreductase n=1 Tax=Clostridium sediminicola TaxID=3114879 RepID=UPI0031F2182B
MQKRVEKYDVVIIGGGAGGLTAGIYCGRARLKTLLIEKSLVGGLATYTNEIENYPGFPEGTTGLDLMNLFHKQAKKFGVKFKLTDVKNVDLEGETKIVETFRNRYEAKVVIIASGGRPRITGANGEENYLFDKGISFCATCDAAANTDKDVMIIGSGDAAIEEGMFLTKFARKVYVSVMHDTGKMDCNEIAKAEALQNPKMEFIWNTVVDEFKGDGHLDEVVLKNLKTEEKIPVKVDTCFEFIGYIPNTEIFKDQVNMDRRGYVLSNENMETNIEGVYVVGDVRDKFLKQVATAVGDGAIAGFATEKYIAESEAFHNQILGSDVPNIVYVYNAVDADSRDKLSIFEKIENENKDNLKVTRVDVYKSKGLANRLGIEKFPTVAIVKDKKIVAQISENITEETVLSSL